MKRFLTGLAMCLAAPLVLAHAAITQSIPATGAVLDKAPPQIVLTFNERVEPAFSSIEVKESSGKVVPGATHVDAGEPLVLKHDLPALAPGAYQVGWVAVGPDGHRRKGSFSFTVK